MTYNRKSYQHDYYTNVPKGVYARQRANARRRNIPWEFTFDSWWKVWEDSGLWSQRGRTKNDYCMARKYDLGAYSPENVEICPVSENSRTCAKRNHLGLPQEKKVAPVRYAPDLDWKAPKVLDETYY